MRQAASSVLTLILAASLFACQDVGCGSTTALVKSEDSIRSITEWVDEKILSVNGVRPEDIEPGGVVGPGRRRIRPSVLLSDLPTEFASFEIRLIGADAAHPDAVFFANRAYAGILVVRDDLESILSRERIASDEILASRARLAAICRPMR